MSMYLWSLFGFYFARADFYNYGLSFLFDRSIDWDLQQEGRYRYENVLCFVPVSFCTNADLRTVF